MATSRQSQQASGSNKHKGVYVYGIFADDIEVTGSQQGVGEPPAELRVVRGNGLAALVSEIDTSQPLGNPDDLVRHEQILDASAAEVAVLPLRFGAVLTSDEAVISELLEAHEDEFTRALDELDGRTEYVVKGRYVESAILEEILSENRQAAQLKNQIKDADPDATRAVRMQLGEIVNQAIEAKRQADTRMLGDRMAGHCAASLVRVPTSELDAVHIAFLLDDGQESELSQVVDELAGVWDGRVEFRILGPMAAYDFVGGTRPMD